MSDTINNIKLDRLYIHAHTEKFTRLVKLRVHPVEAALHVAPIARKLIHKGNRLELLFKCSFDVDLGTGTLKGSLAVDILSIAPCKGNKRSRVPRVQAVGYNVVAHRSNINRRTHGLDQQ